MIGAYFGEQIVAMQRPRVDILPQVRICRPVFRHRRMPIFA
jgi:hypothetical protein